LDQSDNKKIKILIVDDHDVVREGMRRIFDSDNTLEVIGEAKSGVDAISKASQYVPDVVIMDLLMPGMDGIAATKEIKKRFPQMHVLVITSYVGDYVDEAIQAGASGYLIKDSHSTLILAGVHAVFEGQTPLAPSITRKLITDLNQRADYNKLSLTDRQIEMLQLIADGFTSKEIAEKYFISQSTFKREVLYIFNKLGATSRANAVSIGLKMKLIKSPR